VEEMSEFAPRIYTMKVEFKIKIPWCYR